MSFETSTSASAGPAGTGIVSVLGDAWRIVRRARALWWLGAISAAQAAVYAAVTMLMVLPSIALPQIIAPLQQASQAPGDATAAGALSRSVLAGAQMLVRYLPVVIVGIVVLFVLWIVSGVFDVAAEAGSITQVAEELDGRQAAVRAGMRDGFGVWWQTIGLLAVAALPALVLVLGLGVSTLFTYTLPLSRGEMPNTAVAMSSQLALMPLQTIMSVVSVVLGVVVQLALRFVALQRMPWRSALRGGWDMARTHVVDVVLVYLLVAVAGLATVVAFSVVVGVIGLIVGGLIVALAMLAGASAASSVVWAVVVVSVLAVPAWVVMQALFLAWYSAVWTVYWRRVGTRVMVQPDVGAVPDEGTHSVMGNAV